MTTYELPPEPPLGTRLTDHHGETWTRGERYWEGDGRGFFATWTGLLADYGPLAEVPAPALPTEDGALIIASGTSDGEPFENVALMLDCGQWNGKVPDGAVYLHSTIHDTDEITEWTEAVAVPKAEYEELRSCVKDDGDPVRYANITSAAHKLVYAAEEAER